jgi:hypothetical protein
MADDKDKNKKDEDVELPPGALVMVHPGPPPETWIAEDDEDEENMAHKKRNYEAAKRKYDEDRAKAKK